MARNMEYTENPAGDLVSILDLDNNGPYIVFNHEHATEIGTAGDPENARQLILNG